MTRAAPIVFIHYGASDYLARTLRCAVRANPDKEVFLLGDQDNRHFGSDCTVFIDCADLVSEDAARFDAVFEPIEGARHKFGKPGGTEKWLKFVFRRWFFIAEFLRRKHIDWFWTFDSDTLVLAPLSPREKRFGAYQTTTQCRDGCLNGFVGSRELVKRYTKCILSLFSDPDYLQSQRERMKHQAGLAFNEMDAFCEFRRRENVRTFHAAQPLDGEFFDDALAYDVNFEASPAKISGHIQVKRLWSSPDGALYARHLETGGFVRMITCNLSWLPDYVGKIIAHFCLTPEQDAKVKPPIESELREVDLSQPLTDKIATVLKRKVFEVKRSLGR
jgi:hypothetical protein